MAIKIKKKGNREEDGSVEAGEAEAAAAPDLSTADVFERKSVETAAWVEENRQLVVGGFIAIVLLTFGGYFGLEYLEKQAVSASANLTPAFQAYAKPIDGSPEMEAFAKNWEGEMPEGFADESAKWQAVYDSAQKTLDSSDGALALPAKMAKAGAALQLGKTEEAVTIYEGVIGSTKDEGVLAGAYLGLASARTSTKDFDGAIEAYEKLGEIDETIAESLRYKKARLLERKGDIEGAKKLYHEILDDTPMSPNKSDIERRLATL